MSRSKSEDRYRLYGAIGSPYAAKMWAILRYRRLPFDWVAAGQAWAPSYIRAHPDIAAVRPAIIPILYFPHDGSYRPDSTVQAYVLEECHPGERSLVPDDPGHAFLSHLLEDMGDEWGVKIAFQYRWGNELDNEFTSRVVCGEILGLGTDEATVIAAAKEFRDRQIGRMPLVGCTPQNQPPIEESYHRVLDAISLLPGESPFLFGGRPALADFGWFGALFTCSRDPTPGRIMVERSHATYRWVQVLDDASGIGGEWCDAHAPLPKATTALLALAGAVYLPFLEANAAALEEGEEMFEFQPLGQTYRQGTFRYQAKCLNWLRQEFAALEGDARRRTEDILAETGCLAYLKT
ncbi:MAG: glutathione S-transferase C-terminal domain-containing protein [Alphaproteobacteria bacterium]|jgi:glutathione S-transferase|nr:glutathione S-transferase C-terminal domain-containing protein [Alphaproteobacteria bacterium]